MEEELLNAARIIKEHCENMASCSDCIFYNPHDPYFRCVVNDIVPAEWKV